MDSEKWLVCPLLLQAAGEVRDLRLEPCPPETEVIAFEFAISTLCEYAERLCHHVAASGESTNEDAALALHWAFELPAVAMRHDELDPSWDYGPPQFPLQCAEVIVRAFNAGCGDPSWELGDFKCRNLVLAALPHLGWEQLAPATTSAGAL